MSQFKIIKKVDFGPYTIQGPTGLQSDQVPINNYAPKVGGIVDGVLVTKQISDGNGHTEMKTGIVWPIRTNGAQSTGGQISTQFISEDYFELMVKPNHHKPDNTIVPGTPKDPETPNHIAYSTCFICANKWIILLVILFVVGLIVILSE